MASTTNNNTCFIVFYLGTAEKVFHTRHAAHQYMRDMGANGLEWVVREAPLQPLREMFVELMSAIGQTIPNTEESLRFATEELGELAGEVTDILSAQRWKRNNPGRHAEPSPLKVAREACDTAQMALLCTELDALHVIKRKFAGKGWEDEQPWPGELGLL